MFTVSPSILSGNLLNLERQLDALAGLGNLHLEAALHHHVGQLFHIDV